MIRNKRIHKKRKENALQF